MPTSRIISQTLSPFADACDFDSLAPVALDFGHHQRDVVGTAEIRDVEPRSRARPSTGGEPEPQAAGARVGYGVSGPDFFASGWRLAARLGRRLRGRRCRLDGLRRLGGRLGRDHFGNRRGRRPDGFTHRRRFRRLNGASGHRRQAARLRPLAGAGQRDRHHRLGRLRRAAEPVQRAEEQEREDDRVHRERHRRHRSEPVRLAPAVAQDIGDVH